MSLQVIVYRSITSIIAMNKRKQAQVCGLNMLAMPSLTRRTGSGRNRVHLCLGKCGILLTKKCKSPSVANIQLTLCFHFNCTTEDGVRHWHLYGSNRHVDGDNPPHFVYGTLHWINTQRWVVKNIGSLFCRYCLPWPKDNATKFAFLNIKPFTLFSGNV